VAVQHCAEFCSVMPNQKLHRISGSAISHPGYEQIAPIREDAASWLSVLGVEKEGAFGMVASRLKRVAFAAVGLTRVGRERDEYLRQRNIALEERNEYLRQRDIALGERNEYLRQRDIALGERNVLQLRCRLDAGSDIERLVGTIHEAVPQSSAAFFHAVDYARLRFRDAVSSLDDALLGAKVINLLIAKHEYLRGVFATTARPLGFMLDPANQCHLGCPSCTNSFNREYAERTFNQWPRRLMTAATFDTFARTLGLYAFNGHFYNNHEPFLNKLTPSFVRKATDLRTRTLISSNFSYRKIDAEGIVMSGLTELMIAADGVTQPVYERYRRGGRVEWVLDNARAMIEARRKLKSPTPIMRWQFLSFGHNVHEIPAAVAMAREIGFDTFNIATPNSVAADDPSLSAVDYSGQRDFVFREQQRGPFTSSLEPYRDLIEEALSESAVARWQAETGGREDRKEDGERCDWLNLAAIYGAGGRVVPCCNGDMRELGRFIFADINADGGNIMNTVSYRQAREIVANDDGSSHGPVTDRGIAGVSDQESGEARMICTNCPVRPLPQVGLGAVHGYMLDTPALADIPQLYDWSRHVTIRGGPRRS
jgi:hypothetical protein